MNTSDTLRATLVAAAYQSAIRMAEAEHAEQLRRQREAEQPLNQLGQAAHGLWRSVVSGGWE